MFKWIKKAIVFVWDHRAGVGTVLGWFIAPQVEKKIKKLTK